MQLTVAVLSAAASSSALVDHLIVDHYTCHSVPRKEIGDITPQTQYSTKTDGKLR